MSETHQNASLSITSWLVLGAIAATPPVFATAFSQFEDMKWILASVMTGLALLSWGIWVLRVQPITMIAARVALIPATLALYAIAAITWSDVPILGLIDASTWVMMAAVYVMLVAPAGRPVRFTEFALALAMGAIGTGLMGLLDALGADFHTVVWNPRGPTGAFDAAEFAMPYYGLVLPILSAAVIRLTGWQKIVTGVGLALAAFHFGMLATPLFAGIVGGGVLLTTLVVLVLQGFARAPLLAPVLMVAVAAGVVATAGYFTFSSNEVSDANQLPVIEKKLIRAKIKDGQVRNPAFAISRTEEIRSNTAYPYLVGVAFDLFRDQPIIGQGPAGWWLNQTKYPRFEEPYVERMFSRYPSFRSPHNSIMKTAAELGGVGILFLLAWLSGLVGLTVTALANRTEISDWLLEHWGLASGATVAVTLSLCTPGFEFTASAIPLAAALAMLARESALLNELKGLSTAWTFHANDDRRVDATVMAGIIPAALGLGLVVLAVFNGLSLYHLGRADHLMLRASLSDANAAYEESDRWIQGRGEVKYNQALTKSRMGKTDEALELVKQAAELRPYDARVMALLGKVYSQQRKGKESIEASRRAVKLFPNYIAARKTLALGFDLDSRFQESVKEIQLAVEQHPPEELLTGLHLELANYYATVVPNPKLELEHLKKAVEHVENAQRRERVEFRIEELTKQVMRERLQREGKEVPMELMPGIAPKDDGHGHGPGGHPMPKVAPPPLNVEGASPDPMGPLAKPPTPK